MDAIKISIKILNMKNEMGYQFIFFLTRKSLYPLSFNKLLQIDLFF